MPRTLVEERTAPAGDPARHLGIEALERLWEQLPAAPTDRGRVVALCVRPDRNRRAFPDGVRLTCDVGMPGDRWSRADAPEPSMQLATMQASIADLIANCQGIEMFGDNLYLDLDLSSANLPTGSRLRVGSATLEVTGEPHNGCVKFKERFGKDALRFVARKETREHNLRGIYLKVVEDGDVSVGDPVEVLSRT